MSVIFPLNFAFIIKDMFNFSSFPRKQQETECDCSLSLTNTFQNVHISMKICHLSQLPSCFLVWVLSSYFFSVPTKHPVLSSDFFVSQRFRKEENSELWAPLFFCDTENQTKIPKNTGDYTRYILIPLCIVWQQFVQENIMKQRKWRGN